MNNEEKILKLLEELTEGQKGLQEGQNRIERKMDTLQEQFIEHEAKDANRHIEITTSINDLKKDLTAVEIVTSKNWNDIAKLKAVK